MKAVMLYVLVFPLIILGFSAWAAVSPTESVRSTTPPHGLSEILYAYTSATANNGSAFAGLNTNTHFWNTTMGLPCWAPFPDDGAGAGHRRLHGQEAHCTGRAGYVSDGWSALHRPAHFGSSDCRPLTFFPALCLGPVVEHFLPRTEVVLMKSHSKRRRYSIGPSSAGSLDSLRKLSPAAVAHNPVMFVVEVGSYSPRSRRRT